MKASAADLQAFHKLTAIDFARQAIAETNPARKAWLFRQANKYLAKIS